MSMNFRKALRRSAYCMGRKIDDKAVLTSRRQIVKGFEFYPKRTGNIIILNYSLISFQSLEQTLPTLHISNTHM